MNSVNIIRTLCELGERQLEKEIQAALIIVQLLTKQGISYAIQEFETHIPKYRRCALEVDGKSIEVAPSGFVSGTITHNRTILSSLISSQKNLYDANINFNPRCDRISRSNHYFAPALSIGRRDVEKVILGTDIQGVLEVEKTAHTSKNILVGNLKNPEALVISHYDSIATGAVDNASGIALSLELISEYPNLLETTLFALCGNEELSYDEPMYWGRGYRCLESTYPELFTGSSQILVLDSFGHTLPEVISDVPTMMLAFPVENIRTLASKTKVIAGNIDTLMEFYHADNDVPSRITEEYYKAAKNIVVGLLGV